MIEHYISTRWNDPSFTDKIEQYLKQDVVPTPSYPLVPQRPTSMAVTPLKIKKTIFNPPATIIIWNDNTKSVVQCQNGEPFDPEKGFALAYLKKLLGNDNTFNKEIHKWVKYKAPSEKTFEWRVVDRPAKKGDYIRLTKVTFDFDAIGEILKISDVATGRVYVFNKDLTRPMTDTPDTYAWCYLSGEYEVVEKVEV